MHVEVPSVTLRELRGQPSAPSSAAADRVNRARRSQIERFGENDAEPINAAMGPWAMGPRGWTRPRLCARLAADKILGAAGSASAGLESRPGGSNLLRSHLNRPFGLASRCRSLSDPGYEATIFTAMGYAHIASRAVRWSGDGSVDPRETSDFEEAKSSVSPSGPAKSRKVPGANLSRSDAQVEIAWGCYLKMCYGSLLGNPLMCKQKKCVLGVNSQREYLDMLKSLASALSSGVLRKTERILRKLNKELLLMIRDSQGRLSPMQAWSKR